MPHSFRSTSGREMIKVLEKIGFFVISQRGSHIKVKRIPEIIIVPDHKELTPGTFRNILKSANLTVEDFDKYR